MKHITVKKIFKAILAILLIFLIMTMTFISYYLVVDRETAEPKIGEQICNIQVNKYKNRKVFILTPKEEKSDLKILYFHGGSYVAEATKEHWNFIQKLVIDTKATIIMPDYPLTPKYNYKDVFEMVDPLYKEIIEEVNTNKLIVMGDSAGGGLALALMEKVSQENIKLPEKIILISPWLDVRLTNPIIKEAQKKDKELSKTKLQLAGNAYAGNDGINSYLVNPIDGDLSRLNNITILTGTNDILNPDTHIIEQKAKNQGVTIEVKEYENAAHIWFIENNSSEEVIKKGYNDLIETINK